MARVGIIALLQESNTFIPAMTTLEHFQNDLLCSGEDLRTRMAGTHHEVGGFFAGLDAAGIEAVPIFGARALPFGIVQATAFDELLRQMFAALELAGPLDGILVAPHGATVAENAPDADGHWLTQLRQRVGPKLPIIGTLDLHANLSEAMVQSCNAFIAYRTNPHLDQRQRGLDAAQLMARTIRGEVHPVMVARFPPLVVNIERQSTAETPCRELYELADEQLQYPLVLSNSLVLGFPYADVPEMGASAIVVTDGDDTIAGNFADDLAAALWAKREELQGQFLAPAEAVRRSATLPGPVCLLDMGDNVGGGSPGDSTVLAQEMAKQAVARGFICLADAKAVEACRQVGVGSRVELRVGQQPLSISATVQGLFDGRFNEANPRHGGIASFDQGPTAVVATDSGLTVMLTTQRMVPFSLNQLTSCGLKPEQFQVIVAKGVHAPIAAYGPVCRHLLRVDTPGVTSANLARLHYLHRRRPLYPFEREATFAPPKLS